MIQLQERKDIITNDIDNTVKMSIALDEANQAHIVKVLSENYKYPISSTIRESASNAWDSHLMNNTPELPFYVRFYKNETGNYNLEIEDFGLGLDKEGFYKYYMQIGNSSKQGVAGALGFYGCGAKSALSIEGLTNYEVICRKDGIENKFLIFKGDTFPESFLLQESPTDKGNGVLIKVPISYSDKHETIEAIKEQLCYFKTACIQIEGDNTNYLEKKIYENDLFSWSEIYPSNEMHINFGGVHYPIDWQILKISKIDLPVGIKISPDKGINPFFNRESLEYTTLCKETILNKIKEVADWFIDKHNENYKEFKSIHEILEYYENNYHHIILEDTEFKIDSILKYSNKKLIEPKYKNIKYLKLETISKKKGFLLNNYRISGKIENQKLTKKIWSDSIILKNTLKNLFLIDDFPKKQMIDYLKESYSECYFVRKKGNHRLNRKDHYDRDCLFEILDLRHHPKDKWRTIINEWLSIEDDLKSELFKEFPAIPKKWLDDIKLLNTKTRQQKLEGEINFKIGKQMEKYSSDWSCKFESTILNLKDFHKNKYLMVYGLDTDRSALDDLYTISYKNSNVKVAIVGIKDYNKLETVKLHNLVKMDNFVLNKYKVLAKYATAFKIKELISKYPVVFSNKNYISENISTSFGKLLSNLYDYKEEFTNPDNSLMREILNMCEENNFYDYPMYQNYLDVVKEIDKLDFLKFFQKGNYTYNKTINEEASPIIKELLIARKFKMDYFQYQKQVEELIEKEEN